MTAGGAVYLTGFTDQTMTKLIGLMPTHAVEQRKNGDAVVLTLGATLNLKRTLESLPEQSFPSGKWATIQHLEACIEGAGDPPVDPVRLMATCTECGGTAHRDEDGTHWVCGCGHKIKIVAR